LLMAKTLPRKSGREFQRFVNALAWALISLMDRTAYNIEHVHCLGKNRLYPNGGMALQRSGQPVQKNTPYIYYVCVCVCVCVCAYIYCYLIESKL
jgi:hypothetical protein